MDSCSMDVSGGAFSCRAQQHAVERSAPETSAETDDRGWHHVNSTLVRSIVTIEGSGTAVPSKARPHTLRVVGTRSPENSR